MATATKGLCAQRQPNPLDQARSLIDDAFLQEQEKLVGLGSPSHLFRQDLLTAIAHHLWVPPGGLAAISRKDLAAAKKYWRDVHTSLSCLLELLPRENFQEHPQARRMRFELIGKAPEEEQPLRALQLFERRVALENLQAMAEAKMAELSKERIPPNARFGAERILVSQLAGIFLERTGKHPREHIRVNSGKDKYSGIFLSLPTGSWLGSVARNLRRRAAP
jgi:hypothetical protein